MISIPVATFHGYKTSWRERQRFTRMVWNRRWLPKQKNGGGIEMENEQEQLKIASSTQFPEALRTRTKEDVLALDRSSVETYVSRAKEIRTNPQVWCQWLTEWLAEVDIAGYQSSKLYPCIEELRKLISLARCLDDGPFRRLIEMDELERFDELLREYFESEQVSTGFDPGPFEEAIDQFIGSIRSKLPELHFFAATTTVRQNELIEDLRQSEESGQAEQAADLAEGSRGFASPLDEIPPAFRAGKTANGWPHGPLPLIADLEGVRKPPTPHPNAKFASATDEVPEKFVRRVSVDGKVCTSIQGIVSDLLWRISKHWSDKSPALLEKHINGVVFVKRHGKGNYEAYFPTDGALRDAVKREPRPPKNPKPRGKKTS